MSDLWYQPGAQAKDLAIDTCTIFHARVGVWMMAFCFRRKTDGKIERRVVGVNPNGDFQADRQAWGLKRVHAGRWQISPSIQTIDRVRDKSAPEGYRDIETWHETPAINGVPEDEPWCVVGAFRCADLLQAREQDVIDAAIDWAGARKYTTQSDVGEKAEALYQCVQRLEGTAGFSSFGRMMQRFERRGRQ